MLWDFLKLAFLRLLTILAGLQVFGWWLKLDDFLRSWAWGHPVLTMLMGVVYLFLTFIVLDVDREQKRAEYEERLEGASRRRKRDRRRR